MAEDKANVNGDGDVFGEEATKVFTTGDLERGEPRNEIQGDAFLTENGQFVEVGRYFNPVTCRWQKATCAKFGLSVKTNLKMAHFKPLNDPFQRVKTKMDGNCFFRALSVWVTGEQSAHHLLRQELVKFMNESPRMAEYLGSETELKNYMATSKIKNLGEWATDIEIYAASLMLDTTIMVYSYYADEADWLMFHKSGQFLDSPERYERCIYIMNTNKNHFDAVTDVEYDPDETRRDVDDIYREFRDMQHTFAKCFDKDFKSVLPNIEDLLEPIPEERPEDLLEWGSNCDESCDEENSSEHLSEPETIADVKVDNGKNYQNKSFWKRTKKFLRRYILCCGKQFND